jgi:predicted secreted protein
MKKLRLPTGRKAWTWLWKITLTVIIGVVIGCSLTINSVTQPASVSGGAILPITLNANITANATQSSALVIAVLVPTLWNASANTTMTFTSGVTTGPQSMTLIPAGTPSPNGGGLSWQTDLLNTIGHAGNLIPEYEWIAFQSNTQYTVNNGANIDVVVTIQIKVPTNNVYFNMAYVIAESTDGLHSGSSATSYYGTFFPGPVRVNGTGTLLDFVNPQLSVIIPGYSTDNDIITIPFNSTVAANSLSQSTQVYLCATGYTTTGDSIKVCEQTSKTQLQALGAGNWQLDMWPRGFFGLSPSQSLDSIEYFFTDVTGATKVGYGAGSSPFSFTFGCQ